VNPPLSRSEIVGIAVDKLTGRAARSILVEAPPGCNEPAIDAEIHRAVERRLGGSGRSCAVAWVIVDHFETEAELAGFLAAEWVRGNELLQKEWASIKADTGPVATKLVRFAGRATCHGIRLVATFSRFETVYRAMSPTFLAGLRDAELTYDVAWAIVSPLPYLELYSRRARDQQGFTSEFGQGHPRLTLGRLNRAEATAVWSDRGLPPIDAASNSRAYFEIAMRLSGGLPAAFRAAADRVPERLPKQPNTIAYVAQLLRELPEFFKRILRYDQWSSSNHVVAAILKLADGDAEHEQIRTIRSHRWSHLLLDEVPTGAARLACQPVQLGASLLAAEDEPATQKDVAHRYRGESYESCRVSLPNADNALPQVLRSAIELAAVLFPHGPRSLYFSQVDWDAVAGHAARARESTTNEDARQEFNRWERLAQAHLQCGEHHRQIVLGVRIAATAVEPDPVVAVHTAIPLIEETLRCYLEEVLQRAATGEAFEGLGSEDFGQYWSTPEEFRRPAPDEMLNVHALGLVCAVRSQREGRPLMETGEELRRLLQLQGQLRNPAAHTLVTPSESDRERLIAAITPLYDMLCEQSDAPFRLRDLKKWLRPPSAFLSE